MLKFLTAYAYRIDLCSFSASDSACFDKSLSAITNRSYCARTYLCDVEDIHQNLFLKRHQNLSPPPFQQHKNFSCFSNSLHFLLGEFFFRALCARVYALSSARVQRKLGKKESFCYDEPRRDALLVCSVLIASSEYG